MQIFDLERMIQTFTHEGLSLRAQLKIPKDTGAFDGHFPQEPILPGIVQVEIARDLIERMLGHPLVIEEIHNARLSRPILPQDTVAVQIDLTPLAPREDAWRAAVRLTKEEKQRLSRFTFHVARQHKGNVAP